MDKQEELPIIAIAKEPRKIRRKLGRPFGASKKNVKHREVLSALSVESRLSILADIALNKNGLSKPAEIINAIKLITDILQDKVKIVEENDDSKKLILEFANHINNKDNKIIDGNKEQVNKIQEELKDDINKAKEIKEELKEEEAVKELKDIADNRGMSLNLYSTHVIKEVDKFDSDDTLDDEGF